MEAILADWKIEKQLRGDSRPSFVDYLDQRLKTALTFEEYPLADRVLAAKLLAAKGFLETLTPDQLNLPADVFDFDAARKFRNSVAANQAESAKIERLSLKQVAELDPFNLRQRRVAAEAADLLPPESKKESKNKATAAPEQLAQTIKPFLLDTFKNFWSYSTDQLQAAEPNLAPSWSDTSSVNWQAEKQDSDATKSGAYTLNPETAGLDWETVPTGKIKVKDISQEISQLTDKSLAGIGEYLVKKYSQDYYLPGIEYWQFICAHPDKAPAELKDGNYYFFFGSRLRYQDGLWCVPYTYRDGGQFRRGASWLSVGWRSFYRVVLLEK